MVWDLYPKAVTCPPHSVAPRNPCNNPPLLLNYNCSQYVNSGHKNYSCHVHGSLFTLGRMVFKAPLDVLGMIGGNIGSKISLVRPLKPHWTHKPLHVNHTHKHLQCWKDLFENNAEC